MMLKRQITFLIMFLLGIQTLDNLEIQIKTSEYGDDEGGYDVPP